MSCWAPGSGLLPQPVTISPLPTSAGYSGQAAARLSEEKWTNADVPLLDEADTLINGQPPKYDHIVVDQAQDLSPMQLRSVARRSATGSMTVVGDIANRRDHGQ